MLSEHPRIRDRTAAFLASELPAVEDEGMGPMKQISVWVREADLEKADALVPRLEAADLVMGKVTRSDVLRHAVARGLAALDQELPLVGLKGVSDPLPPPRLAEQVPRSPVVRTPVVLKPVRTPVIASSHADKSGADGPGPAGQPRRKKRPPPARGRVK